MKPTDEDREERAAEQSAPSRDGDPNARPEATEHGSSLTVASVQRERASPLDVTRAFGVMLGGSVSLIWAALWSLGTGIRYATRRRRPPSLALLGDLGLLLYLLAVRPWHLRWGAAD